MALNCRPEQAPESRVSWILSGIAMAALILLVGVLAVAALRQVDTLSSAYQDNTQYSTSQVNVDAMRLQLATERARREGTDRLPDLRQAFDIFYSRLELLERRRLNGNPVFDDMASRSLGDIRREIHALVPLIDGPDDALLAQLPRMSDQAASIADRARLIATKGAQRLSAQSDQRRDTLRAMLARMAATMLALLVGVSALLMVAIRMWQLARARARAMSRTERQMRSVVDNSSDAIFVCDGSGTIRDFNITAAQMFGGAGHRILDRRLLDVAFAPADHAALLNGALARFKGAGPGPTASSARDLNARDASGRDFPAELSVDWAESEDGPLIVVFLRDISERHRTQLELTRARDRALAGERAKDEFLAVMSHEMRTPLNGLLGTAQLLQDTDLRPEQTKLVDTLTASADHLLGLVNDILDLAEVQSDQVQLEMAPIDLPALLDGVVASTRGLAAGRGNILSWHAKGDPPRLMQGDARRLRQILLNLLGNAIKFTRNGRIDISLGHGDHSVPTVAIRVRDTGVGIPEASADRIFDDFARIDSSYARRAAGSGLGLGIARRLARRMGGDLGLERGHVGGSVFWLHLPVVQQAQVAGPTAIPSSDPVKPLRLLVVEDNQTNAMILDEFLRKDGHQTTVVHSAEHGIARSRDTRFDAILMDISMPVIDGVAAARRIRAGGGASANSPIVAVTAQTLPAERARFRAAGMAQCLSKPIARDALRACLARLSAPGVETPSAALIDDARLTLLRDLTDASVLSRLHATFEAETDAAIGQLAMPDMPLDAVRALSHKIATSTAAMGLTRLSETLAVLERHAGTANRIPPHLQASLPALWRDSRAGLVAALADADRPAA